MKPEEIEEMKADMEAGTPGPWVIHDCESMGDRCTTYFQEVWNDDLDILVTTEVTRSHKDGGRVNMRRIARVPAMEAEILRLREALTWQPIETAPKDGTEVLMWHRDLGAAVHPCVRKWDGVTHWMPLPLPPDGEAP